MRFASILVLAGILLGALPARAAFDAALQGGLDIEFPNDGSRGHLLRGGGMLSLGYAGDENAGGLRVRLYNTFPGASPDDNSDLASLSIYFRHEFGRIGQQNVFVGGSIGLTPILVLRGDVGTGVAASTLFAELGTTFLLAGSLRAIGGIEVGYLSTSLFSQLGRLLPGVFVGIAY